MQRSLSHRWSRTVTGRWSWVLIVWVVVVIVFRVAAPSWDSVAYDGDFEYLPATMTSVDGGHLLDKAFPGERSRSQIVLVLGRDASPLIKNDDIVGLDLLRRLYHRLGEVSWQRGVRYGYQGGPPDNYPEAAAWIKLARAAFDHSIQTDESFYSRIESQVSDAPSNLHEPRMAIAYWDRGKLLEEWGEPEEAIGEDFEAWGVFLPELPSMVVPIEERDLSSWEFLLDVWSWEDPVIGSRLQKEGARLAVLQLSSELAATKNIQTVEAVQELIKEGK